MDPKEYLLTPIARAVWEDRYALKDQSGKLAEKDIFETFRRVSKALASKEKDPKKWEQAFFSLMSKRLFCPAGRVMANAGTHFSQLLNCYVLPFKSDSLDSIMETARNMAVTQKFGGGCIGGESLVLTNKGPIPIKTIVESPDFYRILSYNPETHEMEFCDVIDKHTIPMEGGRIYEIEFDNLRGGSAARMRVSDWHPFFIFNGDKVEEVRADELKPSMAVIGSSDLSVGYDPWGWLLGYVAGDGDISANGQKPYTRIRIVDQYKACIERASEVMGVSFDLSKDSRYEVDVWACEAYADVAEKIKDEFGGYQTCETKHVPDTIWGASPEVRFSFLVGYFDADGSFSKEKKRFEVFSVSKDLAYGIVALAGSLGIRASVRFRESRKKNEKAGWEVRLCKSQYISDCVSEISAKYDISDVNFVNGPVTLSSKWKDRLLEASGINVRTDAARRGKTSIGGTGVSLAYWLQHGKVTRETASTIIRECGQKCLAQSVLSCQIVKSSKPTKVGETLYDLTVNKNQTYLASDPNTGAFVIVHNTGFNYSTLRPEGAFIKGVNGRSCGVIGFIDMMSVISGVIEQGGCFVGDTLVATIEGPRKIRDLRKGMLLYSMSKNGFVLRPCNDSWLTRKKAPVWKLRTDKDFEVCATENHPFMPRYGFNFLEKNYVKLSDMKRGLPLMPLTRYMHKNYISITLQNDKDTRIPEHRWVARQFGIDSKVIHHKDGNRLNNCPENLEGTTLSKHSFHHGKERYAQEGSEHAFNNLTEEQRERGVKNYKKWFCSLSDHDRHLYKEKISTGLSKSNRKRVALGIHNFVINPPLRDRNTLRVTRQAAIAKTAGHLISKGLSIQQKDWKESLRESDLYRTQCFSDETVLKYFGSWNTMLSYMDERNHKVESVEFSHYEDVYNVEVEDTHNFVVCNESMSSGLVVSNSRRGANMGILEVWHPDIWKLIGYKNEHEWDRLKEFVTILDNEKWEYFKKDNMYKLQMYNISVGITDEFISAVRNDEDWTFRWNGVEWDFYKIQYKSDAGEKTFDVIADSDQTARWKVKRTVPYPKSSDIFEVMSKRKFKATEVWEKICYNAWANGCPGVVNISEAKRMHNGEYCSPLLGTNPCLSGDTLVAVADGRVAVSIKQLVDEEKDVPVYCRDERGRVNIRMMRHPRKTGSQERLLKVTLEGGHSFRVTEKHKFVLVTGEEKEAKDLAFGDSMSTMTKLQAPFEAVLRHNNSLSKDYYWIRTSERKAWKQDHRLIYSFYNQDLWSGDVIHHKNHNGLDNTYANLDSLDKKYHDEIHAQERRGDNNPMRRAKKEWGKEKWKKYRDNMSTAVSGKLNGRYSGISNSELFDVAVEKTRKRGERFTVDTWKEFARECGLVEQFSKYRNDAFGGILCFFEKAAIEAGVEGCGLSGWQLREFKKFLRLQQESDLDLFFVDGMVRVRKACENCGKSFDVPYYAREQAYCSLKCSLTTEEHRKRAFEARKKVRDEERVEKRIKQINAFNDLKLRLGRTPLKKEFAVRCKDQGIPFRLPVKREVSSGLLVGTFQSWNHLKEEASLHNHRVVSVEFDGYEDVYNGTVDEYHNFYVGHFEETHEGKYRKFVYVNNCQCGEQWLPGQGSCNLGSLVLPSFLKVKDDEKIFDYGGLKDAVRVSVRFMDNVIDNCDFPLPEMKKLAQKERRIGLGTMGVHDLLIGMKLSYDSEEGRDFVGNILTLIRDEAYKVSIELAKEKGAFPAFKSEKYIESAYVKNLPEGVRKAIAEHGIRNVTLLTQAPTGSTGTMLSVSTGCEPWFSMTFDRHTGFGSYVDGCQEYIVWRKDHSDEEKKPEYFKTSTEIDPDDHLKMMILFSKFADSSVSKTLNLPNESSLDDVKNIFMKALENGVKGITVFRDGCRMGVLVSKDKSDKKEQPETKGGSEKKTAHDFDEVTSSDIQHSKLRGNRVIGATTRVRMEHHNMYVTVNKNPAGELVEVFTTVGESKKPGITHTSGVEDSWAEGLGKIISLGLRAGVQPFSMIRNLKNIPSDKPVFSEIGDCDPEYIPSPPHAIGRVMEEEIKYTYPKQVKKQDLFQTAFICKNCGSNNTEPRSADCYDCLDCGHSGCGN